MAGSRGASLTWSGIAAMTPFNGKPATVGNGVMVALNAKDEAQVRRLHEVALANGGRDEGAPGERSGGLYAAYSGTWMATSSTPSACPPRLPSRKTARTERTA